MKIWKICNQYRPIEEFINSKNIDLIINKRFLINSKNNNIIELYVLKLATFHLTRLEIQFNENIYIEFQFYKPSYLISKKKLINDLHLSNNDNLPIVTNITYFNDNVYSPTIITNISCHQYKYKDFYDNLNLLITLPNKQKHISFENTDNYYGKFNINEKVNDDCVELIIRIWDKKPDIPYLNMENAQTSLTSFDLEITEEFDNYATINIKNELYVDLLSFNFMEEFIYNLNSNGLTVLTEILSTINNNNFLITNKQIDKRESSNKFIDSNEILAEIYPRYSQRHHHINYYSIDICDWIIKEINEMQINWTIGSKYKYILAEKIPIVFNFLLISIKNIIKKFETIYSVSNLLYKIEDIHFIKYDNSIKHSPYYNSNYSADGPSFIFKILLNDSNSYDGGNINFEDGIINLMEAGDLIIYNGLIKHYEPPILKGEKIYLLCKLKLYYEKEQDYVPWWINEVRKEDK
jgi:hypothetical protein